MDDSAWTTKPVEDKAMEDTSLMEEAMEIETKRARFTAAVSLGEPTDYESLEGLTIDLLSKVIGLTDEELEGKKQALEMLAHYGVYQSTRTSQRTSARA